MVNSVQKLREMKAFVRMSLGLDVGKVGWYGDGTCTNGDVSSFCSPAIAVCLAISSTLPMPAFKKERRRPPSCRCCGPLCVRAGTDFAARCGVR
jgi:hypothetical protein